MRATILSAALTVLLAVGSRGMIVLISDLLIDREPLLRGLEMLCHRKHDILIFHVLDEDEMNFPFVGTTRFKRKPALPSNAAYSDSVRSCPPGPTSIMMSSSLPKCGASPGGSTISTRRTRPSGFIAFRQLPRMVRHCTSDQSWMMCDMRYASWPAGTPSKKLPASIAMRSVMPRAASSGGASATTCGRS